MLEASVKDRLHDPSQTFKEALSKLEEANQLDLLCEATKNCLSLLEREEEEGFDKFDLEIKFKSTCKNLNIGVLEFNDLWKKVWNEFALAKRSLALSEVKGVKRQGARLAKDRSQEVKKVTPSKVGSQRESFDFDASELAYYSKGFEEELEALRSIPSTPNSGRNNAISYHSFKLFQLVHGMESWNASLLETEVRNNCIRVGFDRSETEGLIRSAKNGLSKPKFPPSPTIRSLNDIGTYDPDNDKEVLWLSKEGFVRSKELADIRSELLEELWNSNGKLIEIKAISLELGVDPLGFLGSLLACAGISVPYYWRLNYKFLPLEEERVIEEGKLAGTSQLGLFVLGVGKSNVGKSSAIPKAIEAFEEVGVNFVRRWPPTGAGFVNMFVKPKEEEEEFGRRSEFEEVSKAKIYRQMLMTTTEGKRIQYNSKGKANEDLRDNIRLAWIGEEIVSHGAVSDTQHYLNQYEYAFALLVGIQPKFAHYVWGEEDSGDTQRWVIFPFVKLARELGFKINKEGDIEYLVASKEVPILKPSIDESWLQVNEYTLLPQDNIWPAIEECYHNFEAGSLEGIPEAWLDFFEAKPWKGHLILNLEEACG